jgi:hypothetical protein
MDTKEKTELKCHLFTSINELRYPVFTTNVRWLREKREREREREEKRGTTYEEIFQRKKEDQASNYLFAGNMEIWRREKYTKWHLRYSIRTIHTVIDFTGNTNCKEK